MQTLAFFVLGILAISVIWKTVFYPLVQSRLQQPTRPNTTHEKVHAIKALAEHHEVAEVLCNLIQKDGAGSWPPNTNHTHTTWPLALRAYKEIYLELAPLLPQPNPSLDDQTNIKRISEFRQRFRKLLCEQVNLVEVKQVRAMEIVRASGC